MAILKIVNNHSTNSAALKKVLNYVLQGSKTNANLTFAHGDFLSESISAQTIYDDFMRVRQTFGKTEGRLYQHGTVSWHANELISPEMALSFGKELVDKLYPNNQALIAVHTDRDHIHFHFVVNTVSFLDGKMIHWKKNDLQKAKNISDELCSEYGLSITQKGKHYDLTELEEGNLSSWNKNIYNLLKDHPTESFIVNCFAALQRGIFNARSLDDFRIEMQKQGWNVVWEESRKHVVFENQDGKKVRDSKLSKTFNIDISKDTIEKTFVETKKRALLMQEKRPKKRHR